MYKILTKLFYLLLLVFSFSFFASVSKRAPFLNWPGDKGEPYVNRAGLMGVSLRALRDCIVSLLSMICRPPLKLFFVFERDGGLG